MSATNTKFRRTLFGIKGESAFNGSLQTTLILVIIVAALAALPIGIGEFTKWAFPGTGAQRDGLENTVSLLIGVIIYPLSFIVAGIAIATFVFGRVAMILNRRFAKLTTKANIGNGYRYVYETKRIKTGEYALVAVAQLLIVEPVNVLTKAARLVVFVLGRLVGKKNRWVSDQERYFLDQMEVFRFNLCNAGTNEAKYELFKSSFGMHYTPFDEVRWGTNDSGYSAKGLKESFERWEKGTYTIVLDELFDKFGTPNWIKEYSSATTQEDRQKALSRPGEFRLQNGSLIKGKTAKGNGTFTWLLE